MSKSLIRRSSVYDLAFMSIICFLLFVFLGCESRDKGKTQVSQEDLTSVPDASSSSFNSKEICLAGLATVLAWDESPTGGQSEFGDYVSDEGNNHIIKSSKGIYKCYVEGDKILWGNKDGRWRKLSEDGVLSFSAEGGILTITITFSDGSKSKEEYSKDLLSRHIKE